MNYATIVGGNGWRSTIHFNESLPQISAPLLHLHLHIRLATNVDHICPRFRCPQFQFKTALLSFVSFMEVHRLLTITITNENIMPFPAAFRYGRQ